MSAESIATAPKAAFPAKLDGMTWDRLLRRIRDDKCTAVIGSAACTAPPSGADPEEWAKLKYPSKEQIALKFAAETAIRSTTRASWSEWRNTSQRQMTLWFRRRDSPSTTKTFLP